MIRRPYKFRLLLGLGAVFAVGFLAACGGAEEEAVTKEELAAALQQAVAGAAPAPAPAGPSAEEIRSLVSEAVKGAAPAGVSAQEISSVVEAAVGAATAEAVTPEDIERLVAKAVGEAAAGGPTPLSASEVQSIVAAAVAAIPTPAPVVVTQVVTPTPKPLPRRIEELVLAQTGNPVTLDAHASSVDEMDIVANMVEPLLLMTRDNEMVPWLAEELEMISSTEWLMTLRKGVKYHDPEYGEMKAEDVVASVQFAFKPGSRNIARVPDTIANMEMEIIDDYNIRFKLTGQGTASFPNHLAAMRVFVSAKAYRDLVGDDFTRRPMGTGPFKFVEWVPNVRIVAERFDDYWRGALPVDRVVWRIIPDPFTRRSELLTGGVDLVRALEPDAAPDVVANPDTRLEEVLSSRYVFVVLPVDVPPYDNQKFRQALNYAVNNQEIVDQLFGGFAAQPLRGVVHPFLCEADPNRTGYPYDPVKAKQLIDEARAEGAPVDGLIRLFSPNDRYVLDKETGEAVAGYWRAVGLDVEYNPEPRATLFPRLMGFEMEEPTLIGNGNGLGRAEFPFELWLQKRESPPSRGLAYASPHPSDWDAEINELALMASCTPEATTLAQAMDDKWTEFAPWVLLVNFQDLYGVNNRIKWEPWSTEIRMLFDIDLGP